MKAAANTKTLLASAIFLSILMHLGFLGFLSFSPKINFDLKLRPPSEAEFGFVEIEQPPPENQPAKNQTAEIQTTEKKSAKKIEEEKKPQAAPSKKKKTKSPAKKKKKKKKASKGKSEKTKGTSNKNLPKGSLVGLRIDLQKIRRSPLQTSASDLLQTIPDWQAILEGSGIDPVRDLEKIVIASPNLYRSRIIIAGKYNPKLNLAETATQNLAKQKKKIANWKIQNKVKLAPWYNVDHTERWIALPEPGLFVIATPKDMPRALEFIQEKNERSLLQMNPKELVRLEAFQIEKIFELPNSAFHPQSLNLTLEDKNDQILLRTRLTMRNSKESKDLMEQLQFLKDQYAKNPLIALTGMKPTLDAVELSQRNKEIQVKALLPLLQAQKLLSFAKLNLQKNNRDSKATPPRSNPSNPTNPQSTLNR